MSIFDTKAIESYEYYDEKFDHDMYIFFYKIRWT